MRIACFGLLLLSGCMVGPDYHKPEMAMASSFSEAAKSEQSSSQEKTRFWWEQFNDPFLNTLIEEAVKANYDMRIALEKITQARAQYRVQSSYLWPELDVNAVAVRSRNSQNFFSSSNSSSTASSGAILPTFQNFFHVGFDAIWEFDLFGKFRRSKRAAHYEWEASKENAQDVQIIVISEVARSYVTICALQQQKKIILRKILVDEELFVLTKALFESGLAGEIQVETAAARLDMDRAAFPQIESALKQAIYSLAILLGRQPEGFASEFETVHSLPLGSDRVPVGLPSDLLRRRPDIRRAEKQLAAASEQIGVAVADLFPHIALTGVTFAGGQLMGSGYGYESGSWNTLFKPSSRTWSLGPSINWDLIDFGRTRGNIAVNKSLYKQALLSYEQTVINALQDVEGALVAYFQEQKRSRILGDEVDALKRALELEQDTYQAGLTDEQQVLEQQIVLLDAEDTLIGSEMALTSDLIALYKALGGEWQ